VRATTQLEGEQQLGRHRRRPGRDRLGRPDDGHRQRHRLGGRERRPAAELRHQQRQGQRKRRRADRHAGAGIADLPRSGPRNHVSYAKPDRTPERNHAYARKPRQTAPPSIGATGCRPPPRARARPPGDAGAGADHADLRLRQGQRRQRLHPGGALPDAAGGPTNWRPRRCRPWYCSPPRCFARPQQEAHKSALSKKRIRLLPRSNDH
jgi:hypothetical protein